MSPAEKRRARLKLIVSISKYTGWPRAEVEALGLSEVTAVLEHPDDVAKART